MSDVNVCLLSVCLLNIAEQKLISNVSRWDENIKMSVRGRNRQVNEADVVSSLNSLKLLFYAF